MKRGQRAALIMLAISVLVFLLSLLLLMVSVVLPVLLVVGAVGFIAALLVGLGAIWPVATVWWFNRKQSST
jgi:hypothetical protein